MLRRPEVDYNAALDGWRLALAKVKELKVVTGDRWGPLKVAMETAQMAILAALGQQPPASLAPGEDAPAVPDAGDDPEAKATHA